MKKAICLLCGNEDTTKKMVKQISFIKGQDKWLHVCCNSKILDPSKV